MQVDDPTRGSGRLKRKWMEVITIDQKKCNLFEDLALDGLEWTNRIHIVDPNLVETRL